MRPNRPPPENEVLDRLRRIETRLTTLLIAQGVSTPTQKPVLDSEVGRLTLPSMHSSFSEAIDSIPTGARVGVYVGGKRLGWLER